MCQMFFSDISVQRYLSVLILGQKYASLRNLQTRVFPKLYKAGNVGSKGLHGEEKMNSAKKPPMMIEHRTSGSLL